MQNYSDSTSRTLEQPAALKSGDASGKFHEEVNVMDRLHLKNPARQKTEDLLNNDYLTIASIDTKSAISDPRKFLDVATKLVKADSDGGLSKSDLKKVLQSDTSSTDEKAAAIVMKEAFENIATPNPGFSLLHYLPGNFDSSIQLKTLEQKKQNLDAAALYDKHPELANAKILATTIESIMNKTPDSRNGLDRFGADEVVRSNNYSEQERVAAELVRINMPTLAKLSDIDPHYAGSTFTKNDLNELTNLGIPAEQRPAIERLVKPGCEEHTSVVGNAVKWGAGVGAVSKIAGSDQSGTNAIVAAVSAALAAEIKNSICEK